MNTTIRLCCTNKACGQYLDVTTSLEIERLQHAQGFFCPFCASPADALGVVETTGRAQSIRAGNGAVISGVTMSISGNAQVGRAIGQNLGRIDDSKK